MQYLSKKSQILVNMWFSTSFKTHKFLQDSDPWFSNYAPKKELFLIVGSFGQPKNFLFLNFFGSDFFS
jgi:hypothetical protein